MEKNITRLQFITKLSSLFGLGLLINGCHKEKPDVIPEKERIKIEKLRAQKAIICRKCYYYSRDMINNCNALIILNKKYNDITGVTNIKVRYGIDHIENKENTCAHFRFTQRYDWWDGGYNPFFDAPANEKWHF